MICALASAVCFGAASVLQAVATRAIAPGTGSGVDPGLLMRVLKQWRYLAGLGLDGLGFVLQIVALRHIPIYAVGAALAGSLAVTALIATRMLDIRLSRAEWTAIVVVCAGLAMVGLAAGAEGERSGSDALKWALLVASVVMVLLGAAGGRLPDKARALVLGLMAGLGFGVVQVAVRLIDEISVGELLTNPATYALLIGGGGAFLLLTSALQRGSVPTATAGLVLGETIAPSLVGVIWLGDETRAGFAWLAVLGFAVAVAGALALARFGEAPVEETAQGGTPA